MAEASQSPLADIQSAGLTEARGVLEGLADVFFRAHPSSRPASSASGKKLEAPAYDEVPFSNVEARYRTLVEQIPAVVFMAYLDRGIGEAYVSPQIEPG